MEHREVLLKLCRVCGESIHRFRVSYSCKAKKDDLHTAFLITIDEDNEDIHPPHFCDGCYAGMKRKIKATENKKICMQSLKLFQWSAHSDSNCTTCQKLATIKKGGRPKKNNYYKIL